MVLPQALFALAHTLQRFLNCRYLCDSPDNVARNMTEALLDQPAATHTKSIENYFDRLDGLLKVSISQLMT